MAKQFAGRLSLIAFFAASMRGLISGADFEGSIQIALLVLVVFYVIGLIFGEIARHVIEENVEAEMEQLLAEKLEPGTKLAKPANT